MGKLVPAIVYNRRGGRRTFERSLTIFLIFVESTFDQITFVKAPEVPRV
jgi:hypothetical protein